MSSYNVILPRTLNKIRLDKSLPTLIPGVSRNQIQKAIKNGHVLINNIAITDIAYPAKENDNISIHIIAEKQTALIPTQLKLDIIYEDDDIIVLNKPFGLTVHPGAGHYQDTLVNALVYHTNTLSDLGDYTRPGIVHRLDKDTSGLMIVAKNNFAHNNLSMQIMQKTLTRKYKALVWNIIKPTSGIIDINIARNRIDRTKMQTVHGKGKVAITYYDTQEILLNGLMSIVHCTLQTGRTHQIRVHMSHVGNSIVGDQTYGHNKRKIAACNELLKHELLNFKRQALHSYYLNFTHPKSNQELSFEIDLPNDIANLIDKIKSLKIC